MPRRSPGQSRDDVTSVGALADPSRRALYELVVSRRDWVSREQAAEALGLQRGIAAHHLDRLAAEGLLEVDYRRLTGRRGPGAGRPAKVYRRASGEVSVSLPPRRYELAGELLADAADRARHEHVPVDDAIEVAARERGRSIARDRKARVDRRSRRARRAAVLATLEDLGYEPETRDDGVTLLHNCPFHHLAQAHTELVCGMNHCLLEAVLDELDGTDLRAVLEPDPETCCVRLVPV